MIDSGTKKLKKEDLSISNKDEIRAMKDAIFFLSRIIQENYSTENSDVDILKFDVSLKKGEYIVESLVTTLRALVDMKLTIEQDGSKSEISCLESVDYNEETNIISVAISKTVILHLLPRNDYQLIKMPKWMTTGAE